MHQNDAPDHQRIGSIAELDDLLQPTLELDKGFGHPRRRHFLGRNGRQASEVELVLAPHLVVGADLHRYRKLLGHRVDDKLADTPHVHQRVLGQARRSGPDREAEQARIGRDDDELTERGGVDPAIRVERGHEGDRPRDDAAGEQLVALLPGQAVQLQAVVARRVVARRRRHHAGTRFITSAANHSIWSVSSAMEFAGIIRAQQWSTPIDLR